MISTRDTSEKGGKINQGFDVLRTGFLDSVHDATNSRYSTIEDSLSEMNPADYARHASDNESISDELDGVQLVSEGRLTKQQILNELGVHQNVHPQERLTLYKDASNETIISALQLEDLHNKGPTHNRYREYWICFHLAKPHVLYAALHSDKKLRTG